MSVLEVHEPNKCQRQRWDILIILVTISLLTISLGTRTRTAVMSHGITAQSQLPRAMRQHLDTDAVEWVPPVENVVTYEIVYFYPLVWPARPPILGFFFEQSLYNRPPPSC